jgi:hypothetical protein
MGTQIIGNFLWIERERAQSAKQTFQKAAEIKRTEIAFGKCDGRDRAQRQHVTDWGKWSFWRENS